MESQSRATVWLPIQTSNPLFGASLFLTTPEGKRLDPNLSQYAANRAQTVQREPNAVLSFQQFTSERTITRLLNRFRE
jgi:hypothetical protein